MRFGSDDRIRALHDHAQVLRGAEIQAYPLQEEQPVYLITDASGDQTHPLVMPAEESCGIQAAVDPLHGRDIVSAIAAVPLFILRRESDRARLIGHHYEILPVRNKVEVRVLCDEGDVALPLMLLRNREDVSLLGMRIRVFDEIPERLARLVIAYHRPAPA